MNDSYTRHECGITSFVPSNKSRLIDTLILISAYGLIALKFYCLIF